MENDYEMIMQRFQQRYRVKKTVNLCASFMIAVVGITSFVYGLQFESIKTILRFMTVDGTLFTTFCAIVFIAVNLSEILRETEMTLIFVYYIRLSSVVAESVIILVAFISRLPFFAEHIPILIRYDYLAMHLVLPVLSIASFLANDSPIGKLKPMKCWHGTWFVTSYGVTIFLLIVTNTLPESLIPYYFLNYHKYFGMTIVAFIVIYSIAYLTSWMLSEWNRRLSWLWFRGIANVKPEDKKAFKFKV